jgi:hypothetical protein
MKIEIKHRWTNKILFSLKTETLKLAVETGVKQGADLQNAYLRGAYLQDADLQGAYLRGADLQGADLRGADLQNAYLRGAKGINPYQTTPLLILRDQPERIRAYKLVNRFSVGPYNGGITYKRGQTYEVKDANTDENEQCAPGINLATLDWCMLHWQKGYRILVVEFIAKDIAAIPTATDGKFRVYKCKIVGEKDLKEIGLIEQEVQENERNREGGQQP